MKVFIASSSKNEIPKKYIEIAEKISEEYSKNYDLIFGGCNSGLMGVCYKTFKKNNKKIISVIDKKWQDNLEDIDSDEEYIVNDIITKTNKLCECDLAIILPGGYGTIAELSFLLDAKRSGEINLDIIIVNDYDFYTPFINLIEKTQKEKFSENIELFKVKKVLKN